jgi:Holliday junction resolvase RusA-like endonuclease
MILYGDPVAKGRPRQGKNGHVYTPGRTRDAEKAIQVLVRNEWGSQEPVTTAVGIAVTFHCKTKRHTDGDNMLKLVTDAMNKIVYADDSQIEECFFRVHRGVSEPRTEIFVYELTD